MWKGSAGSEELANGAFPSMLDVVCHALHRAGENEWCSHESMHFSRPDSQLEHRTLSFVAGRASLWLVHGVRGGGGLKVRARLCIWHSGRGECLL